MSDMQSTAKVRDPAEQLTKERTLRTAVLRWRDANGAHDLTIDAPVTLGASERCGVVVSGEGISRMHLELDPTESGVVIRDLASTNGTFAGGFRLRHATALSDTRIRIGSVDIDVHLPDKAQVDPIWPEDRFGPLVGKSVVMRGLFQQLARIAPSNETVLIRGETGSGKELVAAAIHERSKRRGAFKTIDCAGLSAQLLESELFGHARGAFTGAVGAREGLFEAANGGTVFLDEIGELPMEMQSKLLRAIESRTIRRVGETDYRPIDVRIVSATWRDLREMVNAKEFREDLYFRLAVVPVRLPPLRERLDDIPVLVERLLDGNRAAPRPSPAQYEKLQARSWTGNVRALRNLVSNAVVFGWDEAIASADGEGAAESDAVQSVAAPDRTLGRGDFYEAREAWEAKWEREWVKALLEKYQYDFMEAALRAGMHHTYLRKIAKRCGL